VVPRRRVDLALAEPVDAAALSRLASVLPASAAMT